jgi:hypothetical protein
MHASDSASECLLPFFFFNFFQLTFRFFINPFNPECRAYEYRRVKVRVRV